MIPNMSEVAVAYHIDPSYGVRCVLKVDLNRPVLRFRSDPSSTYRGPWRPATAPPLQTPPSILQEGCQVMVPISGLPDLGLISDPKIDLAKPAVPMKASIDAVLKLNYFCLTKVEKPSSTKTNFDYEGMCIQGGAYRVLIDESVDTNGNKHVWAKMFNSNGCRNLPLPQPQPHPSLVEALCE